MPGCLDAEGLEWIGGGDGGDGGHWNGRRGFKKFSHAQASGARRITFLDFSKIVIYFCRPWGLPAGFVCVALPAALQNPQKNRTLQLWRMYLMGFTDLC